MKNIIFLLMVVASICISCDSFVEVDLPNSQLTGEAVFADNTTVNAAMADVYAKLRDGGALSGTLLGGSVYLGLYADELDYYGPQGNSLDLLSRNSLVASDGAVSQLWNLSYNQIYGANAIIEGVERSQTLASNYKSQYRGEGLFVRALVHFYLVNLYGDIPYITTTDYERNRLAPRMSQTVVLNLIISDLEEAVSLLPEDYLTSDRVRPNKGAANAMLARAYLYAGAWAEAANAASAVLNSPLYVWEEDLDKVFKKESRSTIWQFKPLVPQSNANEGDTFNFLTGPPPNVALSPSLVASFSATDQRKTHWIGTISDGSNVWYSAKKYTQAGGDYTDLEYSVVLRMAEQYLIRAEARAKQGDLIGAKEDLNKVRHRAGLEDTMAVAAEQIILAVLEERKQELFTEFGHRFFDLKRTGQLDAVLPVSKPGWNTQDQFWPLPAGEMLANPNLRPQNLGY